MLLANLDQVLTNFGFEKQKGAERPGRGPQMTYVAPAHLSATAYLSCGDEMLIVDRVTQLDIDHEIVIVSTHRKERFGVELEQVRAIRTTSESK